MPDTQYPNFVRPITYAIDHVPGLRKRDFHRREYLSQLRSPDA
jgi:hypothetical protein